MIAETRNSDSDLLDDIFAPATTIEKASRFQPKHHITKKNNLPKSSKSGVAKDLSSSPKFPDAAETKCPVEGSSASSSGYLDVHNPEDNFEYSISNNVLDTVSQFRIGEPEQCTDVSCSLESLDGYNTKFSVSGAAGPVLTSNLDSDISESIPVSSELEMCQSSLVTRASSANGETTDLSLRHANLQTCSVEVENEPTTLDSSVDPVDDLFLQSDQPAAKQNGKFRPKFSSRLKEGKKINSSFVPPNNGVKSSASVEYQLELVTSNPLEGSTFIEMTYDQNVDKSLGSLSLSNRDNQADLVNVVRKDEIDISALGTPAILSKPSRNSDEHMEKFQTDLHARTQSAESNSSGAAGPVYSISEPISVSSEVEVRQSSLVTNGYATNIEASDLFLRHTEVGNEPTTAVSSVEPLDDLFLQSEQSAGKQIGKHRPKPSLRVKKGKKVKSVTFMLPNNGVEPPASAECQSKLVTSSPLKDEINLSAIDTLDIISDPNCNSDEHVEKFQTDLLGTRNCAESNPATCRVPITPSGTASGYSQLDSSDSLDTHSPHFLVDGLIESYEERACAGNNNDLVDQSFVEHEDIHNMVGETTTNYIDEPNLEECAPNTVQNDETGKSSRRVRQRNRKLKSSVVDNMGSEDQNAKDGISGMDEDYDGERYMDEDMLKEKKTKTRRNSCSRSSENESSLKSSKKASGKPDSTNMDPPKKRLPRGSRSKSAKRQVNKAYPEIPHGSRSKPSKREVNKAYLEFPDDELDRRKLAIRDLIRLAGFKEQISNKEAASLKNSFANQSGEQEQDPDVDDANKEIERDVSRLNYHSYMRRPQQIRWSNTETEFFYQAIRQFGTDFAMIQVLFPNRSREQVKAKFKNEQRKHPLQIADAVVHRSKDHSHFEKVIQHLQAAAEQNAKNDPSTASKDEMDENEEERAETNSKEENKVNYF